MDGTVDVVDLTALMPGSNQIAQSYTNSGRAVDRGARHLDRQPGFSKLLQFRNRRATVKNLDIPGTIAARSIKSYARSYVFVAEIFGGAVFREDDRVKQSPLIASLEIFLKRTDILNELERSPVIYKYMKPPNMGINLDCYRPDLGGSN
ncbi:hypothetical protein QUA20_08560 [Microcoleus sp. Pol7_A1]|uniref:hypothetical protein n=1 Tax=Microcoleus sp. Pol7_A1 TaxID=2818893 RepID=UPI002FCF54E7